MHNIVSAVLPLQLYHLESRWLAAPISLGLSWSLTNRHLLGAVTSTTFTTVYTQMILNIYQSMDYSGSGDRW